MTKCIWLMPPIFSIDILKEDTFHPIGDAHHDSDEDAENGEA